MGEKGGHLESVEKLLFYPLNTHLTPLVQLKLRCKELNYLIDKLQGSLAEKTSAEHRLSRADMLNKWLEHMLEQQGLKRLPNGRVVRK